MRRLRTLASALVLLTWLTTSPAHEQKAAVTTIELNARTGNVEVIHRFLLHDVEHAARDLGWSDTDLLASPADQARFAAYVASHFELATAGGAPLALELVGQEVEGRYLWVYQEIAGEAASRLDLSRLVVSNTVLRKAWPEQHHLVNVRLAEGLRSLLFTDGVTRLAID